MFIFLGYSNHQIKENIIESSSKSWASLLNKHLIWIMHYEFSNCLLNDQNWIEMLTSIHIIDNINSHNIESVIKYTTKLPKFFANPFFSSKFKCHVEYSTWIKRNGINYRTINKTYDEVDIGRRSPDDSFGGSRIHWENSPPSSSLIRSQWQISGSYRGYLIMSLHSGGGLLPTINRKFTTF